MGFFFFWGGGEGGSIIHPLFFILFFCSRVIYFGRVVVPSQKIVKNLPRTYKKLPCKDEPHQFSGQRDHQVQTNKKTDRHPVTLLYGYKTLNDQIKTLRYTKSNSQNDCMTDGPSKLYAGCYLVKGIIKKSSLYQIAAHLV